MIDEKLEVPLVMLKGQFKMPRNKNYLKIKIIIKCQIRSTPIKRSQAIHIGAVVLWSKENVVFEGFEEGN